MNFAKNLTMLRKGKNLSQSQLAQQVKVVTQTVSSWEVGRTEPYYHILCALADYFGVTTDQLLGRTPLPEAIPPKVKLRKVTMIHRR